MESTSDNDTKRVKIRRSSGETQYVTPRELKAINERRRDRHKQLNSLRKQRNIAAGVAVVAIGFAALLFFSGPVIVEVPIKFDLTSSSIQVAPPQIVPPNQLFSADDVLNDSLAASKSIVEQSAESAVARPQGAEHQRVEPVIVPNSIATVYDAGTPALPQDDAVEDAIEEISITEVPLQIAINTPKQQLQAWAQAWSTQDVELYLGFYANEYKPAGGVSKEKWAQQRYTRLSKPKWISIDVSGVEVSVVEHSLVELHFSQRFSSDRFSDVSNKLMVMVLEEGSWRILEERSI
jgi:hypothetical protein